MKTTEQIVTGLSKLIDDPRFSHLYDALLEALAYHLNILTLYTTGKELK